MGQTKRFGMKLAKMIHAQGMSETQIIKIFQDSTPTIDVEWLKKQIKIVEKNREWKKQAYKEV